ncbi:MAG: hypothetical protein WA463_19115 [Terriglobales bacterium]
MACPYFIPTERFHDGAWPHRARLPLGDGWRGLCTASADQQFVPSDDQLRRFCNLGYAGQCQRIPNQHRYDAVRFSVARDREQRVQICYVLEVSHCPGTHGMLEYDAAGCCWTTRHPDPRVQAMAACYLESYFQRSRAGAPAPHNPA